MSEHGDFIEGEDFEVQARDTGGLREALRSIETTATHYTDNDGDHWYLASDVHAALGAAHEERGLDVPTDERERNRLYPHPHIPFGACRLCALLARLATPEAAPERKWPKGTGPDYPYDAIRNPDGYDLRGRDHPVEGDGLSRWADTPEKECGYIYTHASGYKEKCGMKPNHFPMYHGFWKRATGLNS